MTNKLQGIGTKEQNTGIVTSEQIEEFIKSNYDCKSYTVHSTRDGFDDIYIVVKNKMGKYDLDAPIRFRENDLIKITELILEEDGVQFEAYNNNGSPIVGHFEDYDFIFDGVMFKLKETHWI